jgi:hypothetical protein
MKKQLLILFIISATASMAQPLRLHVGGGFSNYTGDLQQKRFTLQQADGVMSAGATFNFTDKLAIRSEYSYCHVGANDNRSRNRDIVARNLNFQSRIYDFSVMAEYDIFNINDHPATPYIFAGVAAYHFSSYTYDRKGNRVWLALYNTEGQGLPEYPERKPYKRTQLNIPFGGGVKYPLSEDIYLAFEIGIRKLFTDYLDDVSSTYVDKDLLLARRGAQAVSLAYRGDEIKGSTRTYPPAGTHRGSSKSDDYYYFGQIRISFRMPWLGERKNGQASGTILKCPSKI